MYKLKQPTEKQIKLAKSLGLNTANKTFRVLSAEIADAFERKSFQEINRKKLKPKINVKYIGTRKDIPKHLVISSIASNGFIYFKKTHKYCRPWDIEVVK